MKLSDFSWLHQKYARPEIYVVQKPCFGAVSIGVKKQTQMMVGTLKHSEYRYAKKCQTFLWNYQISAGYTRNMLGQKFMLFTNHVLELFQSE